MSSFSAAYTQCMVIALKLLLKYRCLLDTFVNLSTIYANAPMKIKALALQWHIEIDVSKTFESQAAPDAMKDPQNKLLMSEPAPHPVAKRHCVSLGAQMGFFTLASRKVLFNCTCFTKPLQL